MPGIDIDIIQTIFFFEHLKYLICSFTVNPKCIDHFLNVWKISISDCFAPVVTNISSAQEERCLKRCRGNFLSIRNYWTNYDSDWFLKCAVKCNHEFVKLEILQSVQKAGRGLQVTKYIRKTQTNPSTGLDRSWGFQKVGSPRFQDSRHIKMVRLSALRTGRLYLPGDISGTYCCKRLSRPQGHSAAVRIVNKKFQWHDGESNLRPSGLWRSAPQKYTCTVAILTQQDYWENCITHKICALYFCTVYNNFLLLLPLALQPAVGFGLSNNTSPFVPIYHQLSPSFPGPSSSSRPFQFLSEGLSGHPILLHSLQVTQPICPLPFYPFYYILSFTRLF